MCRFELYLGISTNAAVPRTCMVRHSPWESRHGVFGRVIVHEVLGRVMEHEITMVSRECLQKLSACRN